MDLPHFHTQVLGRCQPVLRLPWGDVPAAGTLECIITPDRIGVLWCQEEKAGQSWAKSGVSKVVPEQPQELRGRELTWHLQEHPLGSG